MMRYPLYGEGQNGKESFLGQVPEMHSCAVSNSAYLAAVNLDQGKKE